MTPPPLAGKVGVVTGASSGIGAATARALAAAGMAVVLGARRTEKLAALCDEIRAAGGVADWRALDLRDEASVDALIDAAVERHGALDALVNNAAFGIVGPIARGATDDWRAVLETNVLGTLVACRAALRHMLPRGAGDILNVGSASAQEAWPHLAVYAASKAAIHTLSLGLRAEVAAAGVRVMTIEVHNVAGTDFARAFDPAALPDAIARWIAVGVLNPKAPPITPDDVARAIVFQLAQPAPASVHALVIRSREN
jgi:NADP-dependent 3-hydroxy acid dehydrogenase YdfG